MTAIANPIRTLTGTTGNLTLDQMAEQLTEANTDVAAALAALTEKGVDTSGAGLADIAALIAAIEAGGGGSYTIIEGTFTTNGQISSAYDLATLPKQPEYAFLIFDGSTGGTNRTTMSIASKKARYTTYYSTGMKVYDTGTGVGTNSSKYLYCWQNDLVLKFKADSTCFLNGTYYWLALIK